MTTALIKADQWLNLPHIRFAEYEPACHFYNNAFRFDEMFDTFIFPLKRDRSIRLIARTVEERSDRFLAYTYDYTNVNIILLEGIFLFKREYRPLFDIRIWMDCDQDTALERAVNRCQEGLAEAETIAAYRSIYIPAQEIHAARDRPRVSADVRFNNGKKHQDLCGT